MEHPARFELSAAIDAWRGELLAQPGFSPDDRRELESHLCCAMDESRGSGMDDERAFALARERLGSIPQIAGEFAKVDPARVWRERAFWMAVALLLSKAWAMSVTTFLGPLLKHETMPWLSLAFYAPVLGLAILLSRGVITPWASWVRRVVNTRIRFAFVAAAVMMPLHWADVATVFRDDPLYWIVAMWLSMALWDIFLIALAVWLMPARYRHTPAPPEAAPAGDWHKAVWRERVFWMTLALIAGMIWSNFGIMSANAINRGIGQLVPLYSQYRNQTEYSLSCLAFITVLYSLLAYFPPLCLAVLLARGRADGLASWLGRVFNSRARFVLAAIVAMFLLRAWYLASYEHEYAFIKWRILLWNSSFVALAAWLMPLQTRKPPESA